MLESREPMAGCAVLDVFAGTGGLGIEALSRGAARAVFVDASRAAADAIRANLATAGFAGEVVTMPAARALPRLAAAGRRFAGAFLDPPYEQGWIAPTLALLDELALVEAGGWVVVEHGRDEVPADRYGALERAVQRCYGDTRIALYHVRRPANRASRADAHRSTAPQAPRARGRNSMKRTPERSHGHE